MVLKSLFVHILFLLPFVTEALHAQSARDLERIKYAQDMLEQGEKEQDTARIAEAYYLLAKRQASLLNAEEAYELYHRALKYYYQLEMHFDVGRIYLRLGGLELRQRHFERSKDYIYEAIRIYLELGHKNGLLSAYKLLGEVYHTHVADSEEALSIPRGAMLDSALFYLQEAEVLAIAYGDEKELAGTHYNLGKVYQELEDEKALIYLGNAVSLCDSLEVSGTTRINHRTSLAEALIVFGQPERAAGILAESGLVLDSDSLINLVARAGHHNVYSKYYKARGEWRKALEHREFATRIYNRIAKNEGNQNISKWRIRLETEKKELELRLRDQELIGKRRVIGLQRLMIAITTLFVGLLALLSFILYRNYKKQRSLSKKNAFLIQEQNHRVKNNLQVVSSMLSLQKEHLEDVTSRKALSESQTRIDSMVLLHRQLYENNDVELIDIEELFSDIIGSVSLTFGKGDFQRVLTMGLKHLEPDIATSVGVIVNELVVNSFKHAFGDRPTCIEITSVQNNRLVEIIYRDFGKRDISVFFDNPEKKGFGLQLIDMILFQIDGNLKYRFEEGSVFTLTFKNRP